MKIPRILIVDDEPDILEGLAKLMLDEGYDVMAVDSGEKALKEVKNFSPDLIILDVSLGGISGYDLKSELNKSIITSVIPVIFLTDNNDKRRGFKSGTADFLEKPCVVSELLVRVDSILSRKKLYEDAYMRDKLTGLYNKTRFDKQARILYNIAQKYSRPFSMAALEIKGLRLINEKHGWEAGNYVLKRTAKVLSTLLRSIDMPVRFSGDRFIILLPETDQIQAASFLERFNKEIRKTTYSYKANKLIPRISTGSATCLAGEIDIEEMLRVIPLNMHVKKSKRSKKLRGSVLIVEDEANIAEVVRLNLLSEGFRISALTSDFDSTVNYIRKEKKPPGFVILDLDLGGRLSADFLGLLYSRWKNTKVFIFTAYPEYLDTYPYIRDIVSGIYEKNELQALIEEMKTLS